MPTELTKALLNWYSEHARELPWRDQKDPYAIWISEVMLQQTRVETVIAYYKRWMDRFPTLESLAEAEMDNVLSLWEGLGYYRRAHNLHQAARLVVTKYGGTFPRQIEELQNLPGIGPYTAAAIAAFAYEADVIALDGNLRRVLSRLFDYDQDPRSPEGERYLVEMALGLLPSGAASKFNQALMDLGAMVCLPGAPRCSSCPLNTHCQAFAKGVQGERPVRSKKSPIPHYTVTAGVLEREGKVLIARRPQGELLGGLWEFPGGKCKQGETLESCLQREWREELDLAVKVGETVGVFSHAYTHFRVTVHAFRCHSTKGEPVVREHSEIRWVSPKALEAYPMGKIDREISKAVTPES
jgi:A/G-specific adenine glycosylase